MMSITAVGSRETQDRPRHGHPQQIELEEAVGAGHAGKAGGELAVIG